MPFGPGTTNESCVFCRYIAEVAKDPAMERTRAPEQLLLQSSPILEAMGNAKTVRNNNSSRFVR